MRSRLNARVGVACLVVASVGSLAQFAVTPIDESDSASAQLSSAAAHLTRMRAAAWLDLTILFTVPAVLYIAALAGGWRSRSAVLGGGLAVVANLGAGYVLAFDELAAKAATATDRDGAAELYKSYLNSGLVAGLVGAFLVLGTVGVILLGFALRRAGATPWWVWSSLALYPIVQIGGAAAGAKPVAIAGYALFVAAALGCATRLLREGDPAAPAPAAFAPAAVG